MKIQVNFIYAKDKVSIFKIYTIIIIQDKCDFILRLWLTFITIILLKIKKKNSVY